MNTTYYETGATTLAVNELILYTDQTRELAAIRDELYIECITQPHKLYNNMVVLCKKAIAAYKKEFMTDGSDDIINMSAAEVKEYAGLYVSDFINWKSDHGYK